MGDSSSAYIFGEVFKHLANDLPTGPKRKRIALKFWRLSREFDFSDDEMGVDASLVKLGLARKGIDPDFPEDGKVVLYGPPSPTGSKE